MAMTSRQGVPDLNGPGWNGTGYNGHKSATCAHHRAPDITPTHVVEKIVDVELASKITTKRFTCCSLCGVELYESK